MTQSSAQRAAAQSDAPAPIRIAAAVIFDSKGRTLLVRKRASAFFMQPGGKLEPGESQLAALARELHEELGYALLKAEFLGNFSAPAANELPRRVEAALYQVQVKGDLELGAEIEESVWVDPGQPGDLQLAPLTRDQVLPLAAKLPRSMREA
jgi:8-oxo-dGTP diphosphatase